MKYVRFYLEYETKTEKNKGTRKKPGNHAGNCLGVFSETSRIRQHSTGEIYLAFDAAGAVYFERNSPCVMTTVSQEHLSEKCKHISEKLAREIHPQLIDYLEYEPA